MIGVSLELCQTSSSPKGRLGLKKPQKLSSLKGLFLIYMQSAVNKEKKGIKDVQWHLVQKLANCQRK
ncbi:hypothetical protein MRX96_048530 [Rhipicephalus microplus]